MALLLMGCGRDGSQQVEAVPEPAADRTASLARKADRCSQHAGDVRREHLKHFGLDYPWWYGLGQLRQESSCREDAKAFDGGKGLAQFMPATEKEVEKDLGELDLFNPKHAIRAQAYYMAKLHKSNWDGRLWLTYCFYNSGPGTVKKEAQRAGVTDYEAMRAACSRKVLTLKTGAKLDLCDVGYDYPKRVYAYGREYRISEDARRFW